MTAINHYLKAQLHHGDSGARALVVSKAMDDVASEIMPRTPAVQLRLSFGTCRTRLRSSFGRGQRVRPPLVVPLPQPAGSPRRCLKQLGVLARHTTDADHPASLVPLPAGR